MSPNVQGRMVVPCIFSSDDVAAEFQILLFSELEFLVAGVVWASDATQGVAWCSSDDLAFRGRVDSLFRDLLE